MGETFEILASDIKKLVIFQRIGGPWAIWTVPPVLIRIKLK
jgi:hypothetical protein